jgi:hypothetical protein
VDEHPPFVTNGVKERQRMYEWVFSRLDDWGQVHDWTGTHLDTDVGERAKSDYLAMAAGLAEGGDVGAAIALAEEKGDVEPLQKLLHRLLSPLPQVGSERAQKIARLIKRPKRADHSTFTPQPKRRGAYPPKTREDLVDLAAAETVIVREIWKKHYRQRNQKVEDGQLTPEEIVALRWDVTPEEVIERRKGIKQPKR